MNHNLKYSKSIITWVIAFLFCVSFGLYYIVNNQEDSLVTLRQTLINQAVETVQTDSVSMRTNMDVYLAKNPKTEYIPESVINQSIQTMHYDKLINGVIVLNNGYQLNNDLLISTSKFLSNFPEDSRNKVAKLTMPILSKIQNAENGNGMNINEEDAKSLSYKISSITGIDATVVQNYIRKDLFTKDEVIVSTSNIGIPSKLGLQNAETIYTNNNQLFTIFRIPSGYLGINNEPSIKFGEPNLNYEKYAIVFSINTNLVLAPYYTAKSQMYNTIIVVSTLLLLIMIMIIALWFIKVYKFIKGGEINEPTSSEIAASDNSVNMH